MSGFPQLVEIAVSSLGLGCGRSRGHLVVLKLNGSGGEKGEEETWNVHVLAEIWVGSGWTHWAMAVSQPLVAHGQLINQSVFEHDLDLESGGRDADKMEDGQTMGLIGGLGLSNPSLAAVGALRYLKSSPCSSSPRSLLCTTYTSWLPHACLSCRLPFLPATTFVTWQLDQIIV